jgi:hypothetical protein
MPTQMTIHLPLNYLIIAGLAAFLLMLLMMIRLRLIMAHEKRIAEQLVLRRKREKEAATIGSWVEYIYAMNKIDGYFGKKNILDQALNRKNIDPLTIDTFNEIREIFMNNSSNEQFWNDRVPLLTRLIDVGSYREIAMQEICWAEKQTILLGK